MMDYGERLSAYRSHLASKIKKLRLEGKKEDAKKILTQQKDTKVYREMKAIHRGVTEGIVRVFATKRQEKREVAQYPVIIRAKTPDGVEVVFDLEKERDYWVYFYQSHNLAGLIEDEKHRSLIPNKMLLSQAQAEQIKALIEQYGFDRMMVCPANSDQHRVLLSVKKEMGSSITHLPEQYSRMDDGIRLSDGVKMALTQDNLVHEREDRPYIKLWKESMEVTPEEMSAVQYEDQYKTKGLCGETLFEYLIRQRELVEKTGKHPDSVNWSWLIDSRQKIIAVQGAKKKEGTQTKNGVKNRWTADEYFVLRAEWSPGEGVVIINEEDPNSSDSFGGSHPSAIFYLIETE